MSAEKNRRSELAESSVRVSEFVRREGYDPAGLVTEDEYFSLMWKLLNGVVRDSGNSKSHPASDSRIYQYLSSSLAGNAATTGKERLREILTYQDELLFIQNGTDISYYPILYRLPAHYHKNSYFDIAWVFRGSARYYFPGLAPVDLHPGDFLIVPPESEHGECALLPETDAITCAIRKSAFLSLFLSIFDGSAFLQSFFRQMLTGSSGVPYLLFDTREKDGLPDPELVRLFGQVEREQDLGRRYCSRMLDALIGQIFTLLLRSHEQQMILPENSRALWKPEYDALFHYMEEHITEHVTLEDLSRRFHYSRRQLIRIIREYTGMSYRDLVRGARIRLACELLRGTGLPIEEIGTRCGYENFSGFSRAFSAVMKTAPGQYRKSAEEKNSSAPL